MLNGLLAVIILDSNVAQFIVWSMALGLDAYSLVYLLSSSDPNPKI